MHLVFPVQALSPLLHVRRRVFIAFAEDLLELNDIPEQITERSVASLHRELTNRRRLVAVVTHLDDLMSLCIVVILIFNLLRLRLNDSNQASRP